MKKYLLLIPIIALIITGCSFGSKKGTVTCNLSSKDTINGYNVQSEYVIHYNGDYVESVDSKEVVESDNSSILSTFESTLNTTYKTMNDTYGGYTINIERQGNKVISKVTIDYNKMDIARYIKDNSALKTYVKDDKLSLEGIKSIYEQVGATCEK